MGGVQLASTYKKFKQPIQVFLLLTTIWAIVNHGHRVLALVGVRRQLHLDFLIGTTFLGTLGKLFGLGLCTWVFFFMLRQYQAQADARQQRKLEHAHAEKAAQAREAMQRKLREEAARKAQEERELAKAMQAAGQQQKQQNGGSASTAAPRSASPSSERSKVTNNSGEPAPAGPGAVAAASRSSPDSMAEARRAHYLRLQQLADEAAKAKAAAEAQAAAEAAAKQAAEAAKAPVADTQSGSPAAPPPPAAAAGGQAAARAAQAPAVAARASPTRANSGSGSSSRPMISREAALEAEARQREWLQQLHTQADPTAARSAVTQQDRALREQQDAEYFAALAADQAAAERRAAEQAAERAAQEQEEANRRAKVKRLRELAALKEELRATLPPEPAAEEAATATDATTTGSDASVTEGASDQGTAEGGKTPAAVVTVRVRMPDGSINNRRWRASHGVNQVYDWVQSLESCPLWEPGEWHLAVSYPRRIIANDASVTVGVVSEGESSVALMMERV